MKPSESTGLLIVKVLNEKSTRQGKMFEVIAVIFWSVVSFYCGKKGVNDALFGKKYHPGRVTVKTGIISKCTGLINHSYSGLKNDREGTKNDVIMCI